MILLRRIQATAARAQRVTPPHPRSMLHAVVNLLALRTLRRTGMPITPSSGPSVANGLTPRSWALLKWMIVNVNSANVAETKRSDFYLARFWIHTVIRHDIDNLKFEFVDLASLCSLPARRYITPVTSTADIWCLHSPKKPINAAHPRIIRHTREHEMLRFCIPETERKALY